MMYMHRWLSALGGAGLQQGSKGEELLQLLTSKILDDVIDAGIM